MTLGFLSGSKNFCKLLRVSCEVLVLHGYDWIHWVAKSCTTIAYRRLFRDFAIFTENFVICCYQVTKNFCAKYGSAIASSARGPCNFGPLTDLALSVFREMRINTVLTQNPHVSWMWALKILHEKNWRVSLCVHELHHPPNFPWILAATPGFQNLRDLSRQTTGVPVLSWSPFYLFFGVFGWLGDLARDWIHGKQRVSPFYHQHWNLTQARERYHFSSILSFSSLTITWRCRWWRRAWRRCRTMPLLSWKCHWSWMMRTRGRTRWQAWNHGRNEVFRIANYPNPVLDEMWFSTIDPFIEISVFIAKLSKRQYCWRVFEDFYCQEYIQFFDIHCCLFLRLHFSIGGNDSRKTTRFRQSIHFIIIQVLFADHVHRRAGVHNTFSFLRFKSWCRPAPTFRRWEECCFAFLLSF